MNIRVGFLTVSQGKQLSLTLMAIFIGEPGLASFIRAKDDGVVVVTNGAISYAEL